MALLDERESYAIPGACFEVYKQMGPGFLEQVYHECLKIEFDLCRIPYISKPKLELVYKAQKLEQTYEPDFVCYGKVILEIKAVKQLNDVFRAMVQHYLLATSMRLGLLANFASHPKLEFERIVH